MARNQCCAKGLTMRSHLRMLLFKAREADVVGNKVPEAMEAAEERLEALSKATIREAESWGWADEIMR